jgi:hypothetical protein
MIEVKLIYPIMITALNAVILIILLASFRKHYVGRTLDPNFHTRMLLVCTCLIAANTFALITGIWGYFILKNFSPEVLNFGRFADRYMMFFAYLSFNKVDQR